MTCKWVVRPGNCNTFWAYTTCKPDIFEKTYERIGE